MSTAKAWIDPSQEPDDAVCLARLQRMAGSANDELYWLPEALRCCRRPGVAEWLAETVAYQNMRLRDLRHDEFAMERIYIALGKPKLDVGYHGMLPKHSDIADAVRDLAVDAIGKAVKA